MLASGGVAGTVVLWDVASQKRIGDPILGDGGRAESVAFSPDGKTLAWAGLDNTIILWDVASRTSGEPLRHGDLVLSVAFSPDGATLVSGADDGTIVVWDVASRAAFGDPLRGHDGRVRTVDFSPDQSILASGGFDGAIVMWSMDPADWSRAACRIANRNLTRAEWEQYLGDEPYHATCPTLPVPAS